MIYDKLPVVLLSTMASEKSNSTNHLIASYILTHREEAVHMGIKDLAEACYVGTGSVSRFVREIGLTDFSELRALLSEADFSMNHSFTGENRNEDLLAYITDSLSKTVHSIDMNAVHELCEDIHSYQNVYAFGLLKAQSAAVSLQTDLSMAGKIILTNTAYKEQIDTISRAGKDDLILIFSYTGSYFTSHTFREKEKHLLLPKIWMIAGGTKNVPWFVNRTLTFESDGKREAHPYTLLMAASLIAEEYSFLYQK